MLSEPPRYYIEMPKHVNLETFPNVQFWSVSQSLLFDITCVSTVFLLSVAGLGMSKEANASNQVPSVDRTIEL